MFLLSAYSYSENKMDLQQEHIEKITKQIRKDYAEINSKVSLYNKKVGTLLGESTEGAEVTGYYYNGNLKKIVIWYYGEMGKSCWEYYYNNDKFFFVYSKELNYEAPIYIDSNINIVETKENRWYFYNDTLIKWIEDGGVILNSDISKEFAEWNEFFINEFEKYTNIFIRDDISKYDISWEQQHSRRWFAD
jgi:hypothetical protein